MLKNESSKPKLLYLKAQKLSIFAMKRSVTQKIAILKGLINWYWQAIKVIIFSHSNDDNFRKSKIFLVPLNRFFELLMNAVHIVWNGIGRLKPYLGLMERFSRWIKCFKFQHKVTLSGSEKFEVIWLKENVKIFILVKWDNFPSFHNQKRFFN